MATLQFKPDELLKKMRIKKYAADQLISEGKGGSPNTPTPDWDKDWPKPGTAPKPEDRPNIPTKLAHHTGGKHFTEPTIDELIQGIISGDVPKGTLGDEETENRMIQEYLLRQQQVMNNDMMIAGLPQDGKLPSRLFYNRPYESPDLFIKDRQTIDDAKQRFMNLTGIPLAKRK